MQVLTSLSGLSFSAASAGFAPTNSADVSAIASAYQVVSSTGTQLHAGTAYLTGVNGAPISASRAGQAANASLSNSAYYDGTGRLISALPDSAAVSAIASSYAESAASGKQDTIEFGYDANNLISSIDGSALAGQGGVVTATGSAAYNTSSPFSSTGISSINGSALLAVSALSAGSAKSALYAKLDGNGQSISACISTVSANSATWGESGVDSATVSAIASAYVESGVSSKLDSSASSSFYTTANESGFVDSAYVDSAVSGKMDISGMSSYATTAYMESGLSGKENVFDAGDGLEFTTDGQGNRVLQVEAPVDIVAGPGIVIDNPDGNTLRVSLREDYEEVLYAASTDAGTTLSVNGYITLSESLTHFEKVKIYYALQQSWGGAVSHEIYKVSGDQRIVLEQLWFREQSGYNNYWQTITFSKYSDTNLTITLVDGSQRPLLQNSWGSTGLTLTVFKIVGVHRIANN